MGAATGSLSSSPALTILLTSAAQGQRRPERWNTFGIVHLAGSPSPDLVGRNSILGFKNGDTLGEGNGKVVLTQSHSQRDNKTNYCLLNYLSAQMIS
jgi:hypothetical protein